MFAKTFHIFSTKKYWHIRYINVKNFDKTLPNDVVSFDQPGSGCYSVTVESYFKDLCPCW